MHKLFEKTLPDGVNFDYKVSDLIDALIDDNLQHFITVVQGMLNHGKGQISEAFTSAVDAKLIEVKADMTAQFGERLTKFEYTYDPLIDMQLRSLIFPTFSPPIREDTQSDDPIRMIKGVQTIFHLCAFYDAPKIYSWLLSEEFQHTFPRCQLQSPDDKNELGYSANEIAKRNKSRKFLKLFEKKTANVNTDKPEAAPKPVNESKNKGYRSELNKGFFL